LAKGCHMRGWESRGRLGQVELTRLPGGHPRTVRPGVADGRSRQGLAWLRVNPGCDLVAKTQNTTLVGHPNPAARFSWVNPRAKGLRLCQGSPHFPVSAVGFVSVVADHRSSRRSGDWQSLPIRLRRLKAAWKLARLCAVTVVAVVAWAVMLVAVTVLAVAAGRFAVAPCHLSERRWVNDAGRR